MSRGSVHVRTVIVAVALFVCTVLSASAQTPVTLNFQYRGDELREDLVRFWIEDFERRNPDISINWEVAASGFEQRTVVRIAAGVAPDVTEMWGGFARDWAEQGYLLDLRPYVERDLSAEEIADFFPYIYQAGILTHGSRPGYQYGLPAYANVYVIYYNRALFAEAGVPSLGDLERQGSWNWQTLLEVGQRLTRRSGDEVTQWGLDQARGLGRLYIWALAAGGGVFDWPENPTRFIFDEPASIQGMSFLQDLIWTHGIHPVSHLSHAGFTDSQVAMRIEGSSRLGRYAQEIGEKFEWDIAPLPMGPVSRGAGSATDMFGILATTKHPEEAWRFVKYLTSLDGVIPHMRILGRGPARISAYEAYQELFPEKSLVHHMNLAMEAMPSPEGLMVRVNEAAPLLQKALHDSITTNEKPFGLAVAEVAPAVRALYAE